MQRYDEHFRYERARGVPGRGSDPNYRGGMYRGLRMQPDEPGRAPYGRNRLRHAGDLGGYGYFQGIYRGTAGGRGPRYDVALPNRYDQAVREPRPGFRGRNDPRLRSGYTDRGFTPSGFGERWPNR